MSINMHRLAEGEVYVPVYHSTCGYQLTYLDPIDSTMVFTIPEAACPIDPAWGAVTEKAVEFRTNALEKFNNIAVTKPYEWIEAVISSMQTDAAAFMETQDWAQFVKDYIRDVLLRSAIVSYLIAMGDIVVT